MNLPSQTTGGETLADAVRLSLVAGIGPRLRKALVDEFGTSSAILAAAPADLRRVQGIGAELARRIAAAKDEIDVQAELDLCAEHGIRILTDHDDDYPRALSEIYDPPAILFVRGQILPQDALAIAIVGARHATQYGIAQAERLAGSLARAGLSITSGLARGIDAAAHRGALAAGGRTLAVLGSGLLNMYPPEHAELADQVAANGAVISEAPPRSPPLAAAFPQRNRIITGMSLGLMVVEASTHSGALISARHAMEQGREVFAVPGRVDSRMSRGCHRLIRDGAKLVETAEDVLEELGPLVAPTQNAAGEAVHHPAELMLNAVEQQVLSAITSDPTTIDAIIATSGLPTPQVLSTISVLEMRHLVKRLSGNTLARL
ncbi:MAG: DNA-processing protein DprA [Pirellulales bacterium]